MNRPGRAIIGSDTERRGIGMSAEAYFRAVQELVARLAERERDTIGRAAEELVTVIRRGGRIFAFGATHSFMIVEEMVYRTGGLMLINPIYPHGMNLSVRPLTMTSRIERLPGLGEELLNGTPATAGDLLIVVSTSGRNAVAIDMALAAQRKGVRTIAVTSRAYSGSVRSRHPSGRKLAEVCDLVLDNGAPAGDAVVALAGVPVRVGPLSSVGGIVVVNALVAEAAARLAAAGEPPPVFMSANLDGGDAYNAERLRENAGRIFYL